MAAPGALDKQVKDIMLGSGGLNLKVDPARVPIGQLVQADDVMFVNEGILRKRYGFVNGNAPNAPANITKIFTTKEQGTGFIGTDNAVRSTVEMPRAQPSLQPIAGSTPQLPAVITSNTNYIAGTVASLSYGGTASQMLIAWDYVNVIGFGRRTTWYGIWNALTSTWVVPPSVLNTGSAGVTTDYNGCPQVINGVSFAVVAQDVIGNSQQVTVIVINPSTGAVSSVTAPSGTTIAAATQIPSLATLPVTFGGFNVLAWSPMTGTANALIFTINTNGSPTGSSYSGTGNIGKTRAIPLGLVNGKLLLSDTAQSQAYTSAFATSGSVFSNNLGGGTSLAPVAANTAGSTLHLAAMTDVGTWKYVTTNGTTASAATLIIFTTNCNQMAFASQVFYSPQTGTPFAWVTYNGNITGSTQKTYLCVNLLTGEPIGRAAYLAAITTSLYPQQPIDSTPLSAGSNPTVTWGFLAAGSTEETFLLAASVQLPQLNIVRMTFGATSCTEVAQGSLTSGMAPEFLTGVDGYELGFSTFPECAASGFSTGGGGNVQGVVQYCCAYQWVDDYNIVHWSAPSPPVTIGSVGSPLVNATVTLPAVPPPPSKFNFANAGVGSKQPAIAYWFRTTNGGTTFYQLSTTPIPAGTVGDNVSDATLQGAGTLLYTTGGELANDPPPPSIFVAATSTRAFAVAVEDQTRLYFSKPFRAGRATEWNGSSFLVVAPQTGAIIALAALDDKLIIFKASAVYLLAGDGPSSAGIGSFVGPTLVTTLFGCQQPGSVIHTDDGIFYQSARGLEQLGRDLISQYIGLPLDGSVGSITSVSMNTLLGQIRFYDSTTQVIWVYDLVVNRWTRFKPQGLGSGVVIGGYGNASWIYNGTQAQQETVGAYYDGTTATPFTPVVKSGWLTLAATLQGFARLYRMALLGGVVRSTQAQNATVGLAYNYQPSVVDTLTLAAVPSSPQYRSRVPRQLLEALQVTVTWPPYNASSPPEDEDLALIGISLEYGVKPGVFKLPASQSV